MGRRVVAALPQVQRQLELDPAHFKGDRRPVERVSWYDAVEFCDRLSKYTGQQYHLPSESQWEYACRAGTTSPFHLGETLTPTLANYSDNYGDIDAPKGKYRVETTDVGSFPPNLFGLYDLHGNVWEWCADTWQDNYVSAPTDGTAWTNGDRERSPLRGGAWSSNPYYCRSAYRSNSYHRHLVDYKIGFRVVSPCGRN